MTMSSTDPFEDVLNLEDKFYAEGHRQGVADGERAGRAEGRAFGIETGFDKFAEAGRLYGRALVWANRLPRAQEPSPSVSPSPSSSSSSSAAPGPAGAIDQPPQQEEGEEDGGQGGGRRRLLPRLAGGARLEKSVLVLHALVEPETLATENATEAVNDFDDRVKRAQGRAKVVERQTGEDAGPGGPSRRDGGGGTAPVVRVDGSGGGVGVGGSTRQASSSSAAAATAAATEGNF